MARTKALKRKINHKPRSKAKKTEKKEESLLETHDLETVAKKSNTTSSGRKVCQA